MTAAYRRLAAKYHPDVNKASDAEERMCDLNAAYAVLGDPAKRTEYDRHRAARLSRTRASAGQSPSYHPSRRATPMVVVNPSIISFGSVPKGVTSALNLEISVTEGRTLIGDIRTSHPWIRLSTNRLFSASTIVSVEVSTGGLREGVAQKGAVIIDSISYGTRSIPVSVRVESLPKPVLVATPSILDFGRVVNTLTPKTFSIRISNGGQGTLTGTVTSHQKWLTLSQSTWIGNQATFQAIADAGGLKAGRVYEGEIDLSSNGGRFTILARLQVVASEAMIDGGDGASATPRDLDFLRERMLILRGVESPTPVQESEAIVISHLMQVCRGGDVAVTLQRAIEGAHGWRDPMRLAAGTPLGEQMLPVLSDLFQRLRRWETHEG